MKNLLLLFLLALGASCEVTVMYEDGKTETLVSPNFETKVGDTVIVVDEYGEIRNQIYGKYIGTVPKNVYYSDDSLNWMRLYYKCVIIE